MKLFYFKVTVDGRHIKSIFSFDGINKLVNEQRDFKTGELQCIGIRELDENGKLVETLTAGDVVAKRVYVKSWDNYFNNLYFNDLSVE